MPKSCFDGYLTEACKTCPYWQNDKNGIGCNVPYPIMECKDFKKMYEEDQKNHES